MVCRADSWIQIKYGITRGESAETYCPYTIHSIPSNKHKEFLDFCTEYSYLNLIVTFGEEIRILTAKIQIFFMLVTGYGV